MATENLNVPENILIVLKGSDKIQGIPKGYIVDPVNSNALNSAREWAKRNSDFNTFGTSRYIEPFEFYTKNEGFKLKFFECANASCQGGKLSFWNCLIEKQDMKAVVGIDQSGILSLLKQSTIVNGEVQESLSLSTSTSTATAIHPNMVEWAKTKQSIANEYASKGLKKTSKWEVGKTYTTTHAKDLYLGKLYSWLCVDHTEVVAENDDDGYIRNRMHTFYKISESPNVIENILPVISWKCMDDIRKLIISGKIRTISDLYKFGCDRINSLNSSVPIHSQLQTVNLFTNVTNFLNKTCYRYSGDIALENDDLDNKCRQEFFDTARDKYFDLLSKGLEVYGDIQNSFISISLNSKVRPIISDEEKKLILDGCGKYIHIDFGDGIYLSGRRN